MKTKTISRPARPARTAKKTGRPARTDSPQKLNLNIGIAAKRKLAALAAQQGSTLSAVMERLIDAEPGPKESGAVAFTYPITLPLSMFRRAEAAAKYNGQTFNDYLVESIRIDLKSFEEQVIAARTRKNGPAL